jgi:D-tyrosyl-tRNA(Tyr) deacylase
VLVAVERGDTAMLRPTGCWNGLLGYRCFPDGEARMNLDLRTHPWRIAARAAVHARRGHAQRHARELHPGRVAGGGARLFDYLVARAREAHAPVECGRFGAEMQVSLTNEGPSHSGCVSTRVTEVAARALIYWPPSVM